MDKSVTKYLRMDKNVTKYLRMDKSVTKYLRMDKSVIYSLLALFYFPPKYGNKIFLLGR
jgi:hypothetical protein